MYLQFQINYLLTSTIAVNNIIQLLQLWDKYNTVKYTIYYQQGITQSTITCTINNTSVSTTVPNTIKNIEIWCGITNDSLGNQYLSINSTIRNPILQVNTPYTPIVLNANMITFGSKFNNAQILFQYFMLTSSQIDLSINPNLSTSVN